MQTKTLTALAILNVSLALAQAQSTVNFAAAIGQPNVWWAGGAVADGNQVRIGFFNSGFDALTHLYDLNGLGSAWNEYGTTATTNLLGIQPGSFAGTQSLPGGGAFSQFDGQKIYLWIFKTANDASPAADYGNVLGYGLFSSTSLNWRFPNSSDPFNNTTSISSMEVNQIFFGNYDASHLYLNAVPEPSLAGLLVLGVGMAVLAVRRKR